MPMQLVFMDAKQSSLLTQILVPVDSDDPCGAWQAMANIARAANQGGQWRCERLGAEIAGEHAAIKYRATSPLGQQDYGWVDPQLSSQSNSDSPTAPESRSTIFGKDRNRRGCSRSPPTTTNSTRSN
jgi:hypothetical protein